MSDELKEARSLFEVFDKTKDVAAYIQAMHIVLDLKESSTDKKREVADNMFKVYWESASNWIAQLMKPYIKEIEATIQQHIDKGHPPYKAVLIRFLEVADLEIAWKIVDLINFHFELIDEGKAPTDN